MSWAELGNEKSENDYTDNENIEVEAGEASQEKENEKHEDAEENEA